MLVFGRNVARDLLKNNSPIKKVILQDNFNEKDIIDLIKKRNININTSLFNFILLTFTFLFILTPPYL